MKECTARDFVEAGNRRFVVCSIAQMCIALRAEDYGGSAMLQTTWKDPIRAKDFAKVAATLAFLAFADLRVKREEEEVAA